MSIQLYENKLLRISWDGKRRIISLDWKEPTAAMTDEDFKAELLRFAGYVEEQKARGILVDVTSFRHILGPSVQEWRIKNISPRYGGAGVTRFAFVLPPSAPIPPMMNQSSPGEPFQTRGFNRPDKAIAWLLEDRTD